MYTFHSSNTIATSRDRINKILTLYCNLLAVKINDLYHIMYFRIFGIKKDFHDIESDYKFSLTHN